MAKTSTEKVSGSAATTLLLLMPSLTSSLGGGLVGISSGAWSPEWGPALLPPVRALQWSCDVCKERTPQAVPRMVISQLALSDSSSLRTQVPDPEVAWGASFNGVFSSLKHNF